MRQRAPIHQFQLTTERYAVGDARGDQAFAAEQLGDVVRSGFTFHGRVGGQNDFSESTGLFDPRHQLRNADSLRAQTVERRQMPLEYEIAAAVTGLDRKSTRLNSSHSSIS